MTEKYHELRLAREVRRARSSERRMKDPGYLQRFLSRQKKEDPGKNSGTCNAPLKAGRDTRADPLGGRARLRNEPA